MAERMFSRLFSRFMSDYGMLLVLLLLCAYFSYATYTEQDPGVTAAAEQLARAAVQRAGKSARVLVVARDTPEDAVFADTLDRRLAEAGVTGVVTVKGQPADARAALQRVVESGGRLYVIAANQATGK